MQEEVELSVHKEKIEGMFSQARMGIEEGFSQAKDDVELLGLMNEVLSKDIEEGLGVVESGLLLLEET